MKTKGALFLIGLGVGGTLLFQNIKNGNLKRWVKEMENAKLQMIEELEDMM